MKKYLLLLIFAAVIQNSYAQISIQPILPLAGMVQKNNLWNIAVINTSTDTYDCRVELTLRDRNTGLEVITATTGIFTIGAGAKQLNMAFLQPIQYNYISTSITNRVGDFIPIGNYTACYRLTANGKSIVAEECVSFDVEPLSPPMLITPADSSVLEVAPTQFTWIPPSPLNLFNKVDYEVVITEIIPGQKAQEAIQLNLPFYSDPNVPINNISYKGATTNFEKDKWYAWQVVAKDDRNYAGKSEVFVFKITNEPPLQKSENIFYLYLQDEVKGTYNIDSKTLHIKYNSIYEIAEASFVFKDDNGKIIKTSKQKISQGDNYLDFSLGGKFKQNKIYLLSFKDKNNKIFSITFSIK
jgi:hypothetical protein